MAATKTILSGLVAFGIASVAAIFAAWWLTAPEQSVPVGPKPRAAAVSVNDSLLPGRQKTVPPSSITTAVTGAQTMASIPEDFYENPPASLAQSPVPASLEVSETGKLVINQRIRRLFEYYLTATGEESLEHIVARIKHSLAAQLNPAAYTEAESILEAYLQYRNNAGAIINRYSENATADTSPFALQLEMKQAIRQSRSDYLSAEVIDAFFATEDAYDDYMYGKAAIVRNDSLSESEKAQALELLDLRTPQAQVTSYNASHQISRLRGQEESLRDQGAGEDAINALREREMGTETAQRLALLDIQRRDWNDRLDRYREELSVLEAADEYPPEEQMRLVEELRAQHFNEQELLRVKALDNLRGNR